jgi:hypothetical protein
VVALEEWRGVGHLRNQLALSEQAVLHPLILIMEMLADILVMGISLQVAEH